MHRLSYRIVDDAGDDIESFDLWTALPVTRSPHPAEMAPPIAPLAFEFEPRAFLKLHAERSIPPEPSTAIPTQLRD